MLTRNEKAWIANRYPYGEGDYMLSLFTRDNGLLKVIAKGVRKTSSRRGGHIDLFNQIECSLRPHGDLFLLTEARALNSFPEVKENLSKLSFVYYFAELIETLIQEEEGHSVLFDKLIEGLVFLERLPLEQHERLEEIARRFEVYLLRSLGFWADDIHGGEYPADPSAQKHFNQQLIRDVAHRELRSDKFIGLSKENSV